MSDIPDLSIRQLKAITAVAKYSSFIAAASELQLSQPGLSRMIRSAEEELGIALFDRTTRHVALTTAGAEFVPLAERILHDLELGSEAIRELRDQTRGHLAISCPMSFATNMLSNMVIEYKRANPNVIIQIFEGIQSNTMGMIRSGQVDFGIGTLSEPYEDLFVDKLCQHHYHVVFARGHRFSRYERVSLQDLKDEPLVSMPPSSNLRRIFDGAAASAGFRLNYTITVNTYSAVSQFVRAGVGVTILSSTSLPEDDRLETRPVDPAVFGGTLAIMRLRGRPMSSAATGFQSLIRRHFAEASGLPGGA
ncbi:LysR family transcriptional regulator [Ancylobacter sp. MQZ15Z-1]|uniref:LysR family transcriptional regulator n=1 Tax=Ancylobacter mangrovi TaxID=2972472 RepID=A0A9X2PFE8_9HYPH|nr:LysR family transcriptional regulator [Ancylobacter mangrovi]MCS0497711.1 LysR family transcriptional regulator [Ancylobacter mangrovi]